MAMAGDDGDGPLRCRWSATMAMARYGHPFPGEASADGVA